MTDTDYINQLLTIAIDNQVKLIIPTIDTELLILSQNIDLFKKNKIDVLISNEPLIKIFRDKRATHVFFENHNINCAKQFSKDNFSLPIYIKPFDGSRSQDNFLITKQEQLTDYHFENEKLMFLEYLDHNIFDEFTIDLYYDKSSNLKCIVPRKRVEVRDGEVNKAITKSGFFIDEIMNKLSFIAGFRGCITLQIFVNKHKEQIFGIEINPRFGGGFPLSYLAGANFPIWIIQEYLLNQTIDFCDNWEQNLMMLRYDHEVLISNFVE